MLVSRWELIRIALFSRRPAHDLYILGFEVGLTLCELRQPVPLTDDVRVS